MKDAAGHARHEQDGHHRHPVRPGDQPATWVASGDVTVRASYPFKINLFGIVVFDSTINSRTTERVE